MIKAEHIKDLVDAQPFKPFRICMSDGKTYDITNHDAALVKKDFIEVAINPNARGIAADFDRLAIIHITRVRDLPRSKRQSERHGK